jgi:hypothetical protein
MGALTKTSFEQSRAGIEYGYILVLSCPIEKKHVVVPTLHAILRIRQRTGTLTGRLAERASGWQRLGQRF